MILEQLFKKSSMRTLREILGVPVLFHTVLWHGKDGPSQTGYDSRDPSAITKQLDQMQSLGGDDCGAILLTYGPTVSPFIHEACMNMADQLSSRKMPFALCYDPWTASANGVKFTTPTQASAALIAALQNVDTQFLLNDSSYISTSIGKIVLDFSTGASKAAVTASVPGLDYMMNGPDFDWPRFPQRANTSRLPCAYLQFDDGTGPNRNLSATSSGPVRLIPSLAGTTFLSAIAPNVSSLTGYIQIVTRNDISESTDIEKFAAITL